MNYEKYGMFCVIVGLITTALGVGGVEQSLDDAGLFAGALVSLVGCGIMGCGVLMIRQSEEYRG